MRLDVSYKIVNTKFDKEYAEEHNYGEEGPENMKYHETWKYRIESVDKQTQHEDSFLEIKGISNAGEKQIFKIKNVFQLSCELNDKSMEDFYVSTALIKNIYTTIDKNGNGRFYFYLNIGIPFTILNDTCYIIADDLPKELKENKWESLTLPNKVKSKLISQSGTLTKTIKE